MSTRVVDRVDSWDQRSFTNGYAELNDLAGTEFSGVVRANGAELYMTKGVVVGIRMGDIDDFEEASGTIFEAPSPALPMLAIMQERSDEVRDNFYSEKTSISEVDRTLANGGFTGYIELSENVLSGDYYLVYHAGESMSIGFVGESSRLIDGDEAFETADDEVGIYEVRPVGIEPIDIPEVSDTNQSAATDSGANETTDVESSADEKSTDVDTESGGTASPATNSVEHEETETDEASLQNDRSTSQEDETRPETDTAVTNEGQPAGDGATQSEPTKAHGHGRASKTSDEPATDRRDRDGTGAKTSQAKAATETASPTRTDDGASVDQSSPPEPATGSQPSAAQKQSEPSPQRTQSPQSGDTKTSQGGAASQPSQRSTPTPSLNLERRAIPSLDPSRTKTPEQETKQSGTSQHAETARNQTSAVPQSNNQNEAPRASEKTNEAGSPATTEQQDSGERVDADRLSELADRLEEREAEIERLEETLESTEEKRESLEAELDTVTAERDELVAEVQTLESELERLETELGAATEAERRMTPSEAFSGTDIFIRYHSKGDATLEKAHGGSIRKEDVTENLRLEKHTQFDKSAISVGGKTYEEFLEDTVEYQFVEWVVRDLLFEIRDTGHAKALKDLYDVLPQIDRAELAGVIEVTYTDDGQETRSQESFDVVLRNRMGNPLLVANLNDSREAATEGMMENLITSAERVGQSADEFSGAFLVTSSFFEPGALEIASDATKGGILSRDKRKSYVNLTRKNGYHLCLIEARNENFHVAVPEL